MIEVTDEQLVKAFTLWVSDYHENGGLFDDEAYEQYKDLSYPEFAKEAFKYYINKIKGDV
jgi:hypothetical protein